MGGWPWCRSAVMGCGAGQRSAHPYAIGEVVAVGQGECTSEQLVSHTAFGGSSSSSSSRPRPAQLRQQQRSIASSFPVSVSSTSRGVRMPLRRKGVPEWEEIAFTHGFGSAEFRDHIMGISKTLQANTLPACRRLSVELRGLLDSAKANSESKAPEQCMFAGPKSVENRPLEWVARLPGPADTPYAHGTFRLALEFPENYPMKPPSVKFVSTIYHPNVSSSDGKICLNVLTREWTPLLKVSTLLLCVSALLSQPNPEDPLNEKAAAMFQECPAEFARVAQEWTRKYAPT